MLRFAKWLILAALLLALFSWPLTRPLSLESSDLPEHAADPVNGELVFHAGGCTSCHGERLEGGLELKSDFGTFVVPNISPDPDTGIGQWTTVDLVNAMMLGTSPDGRHYYPSFPYASYTRMKVQDVMDLKAYLDTLEPVDHAVGSHELGFPWNIRRGIGLWKMLYLDQDPVADTHPESPAVERGRYLVEGAGHCGECHTPRNWLGGPRNELWLAGAPDPEGEGRVPNITPRADGFGAWPEADITYFMQSGFKPDYDTVGGSMVKVQEHLALLPVSDLEAISAYLKAIPARP